MDFSNTDLSNASFENAKFFESNIDGANLSYSNFNNALIYKSSLDDANLSFAKLDNTNTVIGVQVVHNDIATSEQAGIDFLNTTYKTNDVWRQTYIDGSQRKNYAGLGYSYDRGRDAFIAPQPDPTWVLNETTCRWEAPAE